MVKQFRSMTYPYVAWISVMIVLPMLLIVLYAFTVSGNEVLTFQFTFDNFKRFVTDTVFMEVLGRSLYIALLTTLICIVLGYPKNMNNTEGERCEKTKEFAQMLERRTGLSVVLWDERLTTVAADRHMMESGIRRENRKQYVDEIAAVFILQGYLDSLAFQKH